MDRWSRLLIAACVLHTACDDDPGELDESDPGTVEPRSVMTVNSSTSDEHPLAWASGTKVVVGNDNRLHAVYHDVGRIKYVTSVDGVVWAASVTLAGGANNVNASQPTIAVADDGTIGVAYRESPGEIRYRFKPANGPWSSSFKVTADASSGPGGVSDPSIVAFGGRMHLAWSKSWSVHYASFPANQLAPLATAERVDHDASCIGSGMTNYPAIAVSRRSASDPAERVRIAFFDRYSDCVDSFFAITVAERQSGGSWQYVKEQAVSSPSVLYPVSMSHAAIPTTGDFYIGVSYTEDGVGTTEIWYENAWNNDTWRGVTAFAEESYVDVSAKVVDCVPTLRYALNYPFGVPGELGNSFGGYGQTFVRTGRWTGAQATAPTWADQAPVLIDSDGSTPEALFFRKTTGNSTRHVRAVYARWLPVGGKSIVEETFTVPAVPGPAQNPCKQPQPLVGLGGHSSIAADAE